MLRNIDTSYEDVRFQVFTTRGFFMNYMWKTDDRPAHLRNDGMLAGVEETQEGWHYGTNQWIENFVTREFEYAETFAPYQYNASRMLAGNIGDPLAVTADKTAGYTTWMAGRLTYPLGLHSFHPMAAYRPLYGGEGQYHGTIEVHNELYRFVDNVLEPGVQSSAFSSANTLSAGGRENMSVLVIDNTDKAILGSHNVGFASKEEGFAFLEELHILWGLYYMHSHPKFRVSALANYLDSVDGWIDHVGGVRPEGAVSTSAVPHNNEGLCVRWACCRHRLTQLGC